MRHKNLKGFCRRSSCWYNNILQKWNKNYIFSKNFRTALKFKRDKQQFFFSFFFFVKGYHCHAFFFFFFTFSLTSENQKWKIGFYFIWTFFCRYILIEYLNVIVLKLKRNLFESAIVALFCWSKNILSLSILTIFI